MEKSASSHKSFDRPYLLIVEGKDDENFFEAYLNYLSSLSDYKDLKNKFQISSIGGKSNLPSALKTIKITPGFDNVESLAIILDANSSPKGTLQSIKAALRKAGLPVPTRAMELCGEKPKVLIILIPDSSRPGMLEDLCLESVRNDPAIGCIENYFSCLKDKNIETSSNHSKANCLAFLASRSDLPNNIGLAAKKGVWPFDSPAFEKIKNCLIQLSNSTL